MSTGQPANRPTGPHGVARAEFRWQRTCNFAAIVAPRPGKDKVASDLPWYS